MADWDEGEDQLLWGRSLLFIYQSGARTLYSSLGVSPVSHELEEEIGVFGEKQLLSYPHPVFDTVGRREASAIDHSTYHAARPALLYPMRRRSKQDVWEGLERVEPPFPCTCALS